MSRYVAIVDQIDMGQFVQLQRSVNATPWNGKPEGTVQIETASATRLEDNRWRLETQMRESADGFDPKALVRNDRTGDQEWQVFRKLHRFEFNDFDFGERQAD